MAWPAAGASSTIRSAAPARSSCLTLPSTRMSLMPGDGGGHHVEGARAHQPLRDPPHAVVLEVLEQGVVGRERAGPHLGRTPASPGAARSPRRSSGARVEQPARPLLPSTSTIRVDSPARAAMRASAAVTVVLPTPPFPATMTSRVWEQNPAGSNRVPSRRFVRPLRTLASVVARARQPRVALPAARRERRGAVGST